MKNKMKKMIIGEYTINSEATIVIFEKIIMKLVPKYRSISMFPTLMLTVEELAKILIEVNNMSRNKTMPELLDERYIKKEYVYADVAMAFYELMSILSVNLSTMVLSTKNKIQISYCNIEDLKEIYHGK